MAEKKDETQGAEFPADDKPKDGVSEEGKTPDIVDAEFEEIRSEGASRDDETPDATTPGTDATDTPDGDTVTGGDAEIAGDPDDSPDEAVETAEAELLDDPVADTEIDPELIEPEAETAQDPQPAPPPMPTETVVERTVIQKRGFWPVFIGGVVAAGAGFVAARADLPPGVESSLPAFLRGTDYATPIAALEDTTAAQSGQLTETGRQVSDLGGSVDALSTRIDDLDGRLSGLQIPDVNPLQDGIAALQGDMANVQDGLGDLRTGIENLTVRLDALDVRVSTLEKRPIAENLSDEAIAAYERELDGVRRALADERTTIREEFDTLIAEQGGRLAGIVDDEKTRIDALLADAQSMVDDATTMAENTNRLQEEAAQAQRLAAAQTSVAIIRGALSDGEPYADSLGPIGDAGAEVPAALSGPAGDGVPTQGMLLAEFPPAARDALDAARLDDPNSTKGIGAFLKRQLGARSTTPQEGNDTDAILSRAEDALKREDLSTALIELDALPPVAAEKMAGWVEMATQRRDALAAVNAVAADLNTN
ncbi:COG4223 family protein [Marinibacterium sp. SX1]|uniref:COG4223 family protein n=1 Tax=Marinibacterium sp. SX1 TaxID=3388424 RepID=UPI003D1690CB